jgi:hypothetical protein
MSEFKVGSAVLMTGAKRGGETGKIAEVNGSGWFTIKVGGDVIKERSNNLELAKGASAGASASKKAAAATPSPKKKPAPKKKKGPSRSLFDPLVWTNLLFLGCVYHFYTKQHYAQAAVLSLSAFASFIFHKSKESSFSVLDKLLALGTIGCSLYTLHDSYEAKGLDRQVKAAIGTLAGATLAALSFWYKAARKGGKAYDHAMWHVALFYAQVVLCVIAVECNGASAMTFVNRCVLPAFEIPAFEMPAFAFEMPTFGSSAPPEVTEAVPPEVPEDPSMDD